ncbi:MAG: glycosyltransferase [Elusimicrobia bacterium]|nr:glycosyltransferase [Elusimicrobiota bacterium]
MRVSGVITAINEAPTIREVLRAAKPFVSELIVVDGRSSDGTPEIAREEGAWVLQDNGRGKGEATRLGIEAASGELVLIMTADGSDDYASIPHLLEPLFKGRADLVVGSRYLGGSEELSITLVQLIRSMGNISLNVLINWRWRVQLSDVLNGFRAMRRDAALGLGLSEDSAAIEVEMVVKALRRGLKVINIPTHEFARRYGETRLQVWREGAKIYWCTLRHLL